MPRKKTEDMSLLYPRTYFNVANEKYYSKITYKGNTFMLGYFDDEETAFRAYKHATSLSEVDIEMRAIEEARNNYLDFGGKHLLTGFGVEVHTAKKEFSSPSDNFVDFVSRGENYMFNVAIPLGFLFDRFKGNYPKDEMTSLEFKDSMYGFAEFMGHSIVRDGDKITFIENNS